MSEELEPKKTPFADKPADITGMVSSVLKPQTEEERAKIEQEIAKKKAKMKGEKTIDYKIFVWLFLALLVVIGLLYLFKSPAVRSLVSTQKRILIAKFNPELKQLKVISLEQKVSDKDVILEIKTTPVVDKISLLSGKEKAEGKMLSTDKDGYKLWRVELTGLKKRKYEYKLYYKETSSGKYGYVPGSFEIK